MRAYVGKDVLVSDEEWQHALDTGYDVEKSVFEPPPSGERYFKTTQLNFGPQHPAAHGVLRLILQLDGEVIVASDICPNTVSVVNPN